MKHDLELAGTDVIPLSKYLEALGWKVTKGKGEEILRLVHSNHNPVSFFQRGKKVYGFDKAQSLVSGYHSQKGKTR